MPSSYANNYQINFPSPISSNQGDVRLDQTISDEAIGLCALLLQESPGHHRALGRLHLHYCAEAGSPLQGGYNTPEIDEGLTFAHNYVFSPRLLNEFRGGFNAQHTSETQSYSDRPICCRTPASPSLSRTRSGPRPRRCSSTDSCPPARAIPACSAARSFRLSTMSPGPHGKHNFKFGADFKRLTDHDDNVFGNYRSGWYVFDGSSTAVGSDRSAIPTAGAFLLRLSRTTPTSPPRTMPP